MKTVLVIKVIVILIFLSQPVSGCPVKLHPGWHELEEYETIFLGEVVAINLTQYTERRQAAIASDAKNRRWFSTHLGRTDVSH